ncbi:NAD(P)/FAD-dependent oxidoreductase [Alkalihalobacillus sp. TS-13]|uniref:NAD(P)/FAD-dependent oxidoreductase n=1 Tax=Alkalihalobacillus sp. TS-13 TaxID=2842455 RepID=UPI001C873F3A|nr:FAD-dependent oxidoreductase [Alkalihalobacillus sp. TS-13]
MKTDVLIIGGGPAGLNAAIETASRGIKTIIIEESYALGGQLKQQTQFFNNLPKQFDRQRGIHLMRTLIDRLSPLPITCLLKHKMIGVYKDGRIGIANDTETFPIDAKKVIVTTGAAEETDLFPGWTLPGVMTVGAAQILINRERVLPGKNALIVGLNSFSAEVAKQLKACGINILGVMDKTVSVNDKKLVEGLEDKKIRVMVNTVIERATGAGEVKKVTINNDGKKEDLDIDLICIGKGLAPILEPLEILDCEFGFQAKLGGLVPKYYSTLGTSNPSVYVAGNAAGITCLGGILLTAEIAALNALKALGVLNDNEVKVRSSFLWDELRSMESEESIETFIARVAHIKEFHEECELPLPASFHAILEGC